VLIFKLFIDKWLRAFSRLSARGIVYWTHGVLVIDAQEDWSSLGEMCGYVLFLAGVFSMLVG
jgi:hypothetical protein